MILPNATFDNHGIARLGEDACDGESPSQALELQRRIVSSLAGKPDKPIYELTVYVGDHDLTFHGMSRDGLKRLSAELARLAADGEPRPTIAELDTILNSEDDRPITINPDGSITAL